MGCYNSTIVEAPLEVVWRAIRNFHQLPWAEGVITSVDVVGERGGDQVGAKRVLNGLFHETLRTLDDAEHRFSYTIDDGPEPISSTSVADYVGAVQLLPVTDEDRTFVEWRSTFQSDDPEAVVEFCNPIYIALLAALKRSFDG